MIASARAPRRPARLSALLPRLALAAALALGACKPGEPAPAPAAAPTGPQGKTGSAQVRGRVFFRGPVPDPGEAPHPFPECKGRPQRALVVAEGGGLQNAFVWVKEGLPPGAYPVPTTPVELNQKECEFEPRVFGIRPGQPLLLRNSDPLLHNVHARGQGAGFSRGPNTFNKAMPIQNSKLTVALEVQQVAVTITCDVHSWMRAYAGVVDHPFFAVTDAAGSFSLEGLPAGHYTLEAWHERLGRTTAQVELAEGGTGEAVLEFKP